jgi:hypothetical protein
MLRRICGEHSRIVVTFLAVAAIALGCSNPGGVSSALHSQMAPFAQSRTQAIAVVAITKKNLDPDSINQVNVKYAALQGEINEYVGFVVESFQVASFDESKNREYALALGKTIDGFNGSVEPMLNLLKTRPGITSIPLPLQTQWVPDFSSSLNAGWQNYHDQLNAMPAPDRMKLAQQLKTEYAWPNFQDIVTEKLPLPLTSPTTSAPH